MVHAAMFLPALFAQDHPEGFTDATYYELADQYGLIINNTDDGYRYWIMSYRPYSGATAFWKDHTINWYLSIPDDDVYLVEDIFWTDSLVIDLSSQQILYGMTTETCNPDMFDTEPNPRYLGPSECVEYHRTLEQNVDLATLQPSPLLPSDSALDSIPTINRPIGGGYFNYEFYAFWMLVGSMIAAIFQAFGLWLISIYGKRTEKKGKIYALLVVGILIIASTFILPFFLFIYSISEILLTHL